MAHEVNKPVVSHETVQAIYDTYGAAVLNAKNTLPSLKTTAELTNLQQNILVAQSSFVSSIQKTLGVAAVTRLETDHDFAFALGKEVLAKLSKAITAAQEKASVVDPSDPSTFLKLRLDED